MNNEDSQIKEAVSGLTSPADSPDFFDRFEEALEAEPAHEVGKLRLRLIGGGHWQLPASGVLVAAALALVVGLQSTVGRDGGVIPTTQPQIALPPSTRVLRPLLISDVTTRSLENLRTLTGLSGVVASVTTSRDVDNSVISTEESTAQFKVGSDGSYRQDFDFDNGNKVTSVYRSSDLTQINLMQYSGVSSAVRIVGRPQSGSDWLSGITSVDSFSGLLQQARATGESLSDVSSQGRDAWQIVAPLPDRDIVVTPDHMTLLIDKETLLPLEVHLSRKSQPMQSHLFSDYQLNPSFDPDAFTVTIPKSASLEVIDHKLRVTTQEELSGQSSHQPLTPKFLPDGFTFQSASFARNGLPSGAEGGNPPDRDVIWLSYQRGLERISVITRRTGADRSAWSDPFGVEGLLEEPRRIALNGGAFSGETAYLHPGPIPQPHLWVIGPTLVLTVSGDITAEEAEQIAKSMS